MKMDSHRLSFLVSSAVVGAALIAVVANSRVAAQDGNISNGLVAHYPFNGNANDESGNGHHGIQVNTVSTTDRNGAPNSAFHFNGVNAYVTASGVPIPTNNAFSWGIWIKSEVPNASKAIIERAQAIGNNLLSPSLWWRTSQSLGFASYPGDSVELSPKSVPVNEWFHVVCTSRMDGTRSIYVNGALAAEGFNPSYGQELELFIFGGDRLQNPGAYFQGSLDDIRIYDRALSVAEVTQLFHWPDADADGVPDSSDNCPSIANPTQGDCNSDGVGDACELASGGSPHPGAVQWTVASGGNGHWYWSNATLDTWTGSKQRAIDIGGHLLTVANAAEQAFVWSVLAGPLRWLGGFQPPGSCEPDCGWQWVTGEEWTYTRWDAGEPSNAGGVQDYLMMTNAGWWHDQTPGYYLGSIVEWSAGITAADCNSNSIPDSCDIASGLSTDTDSNGVPDECKSDCNSNGILDVNEIAQGSAADCNSNFIPDACEDDSRAVSTGNMGAFGNGVPALGTLASCVSATTSSVIVRVEAIGDLGAPTEYASLKLGNTVVATLLFQTTGHDCPATPDVATLTLSATQWNAIVANAGVDGDVAVTLTASTIVDGAQCGAAGFAQVSVAYGGPRYDCDGDELSDLCEIAAGAVDCNNNGALDSCELLSGAASDIDSNGVIDSCQIDCNANTLPDSYEIAQSLVPDCNGNAIPDSCDIASAFALDCNSNAIPDSCDLASAFALDCNGNAIPDSCDIASGFAHDCNSNAIPDSCDIASSASNDVDSNGVPDECKADCNGNGLPDAWEISQSLVLDCNNNAIPDSCDIASGVADDCNANAIPDTCDIAQGMTDKDSDGQPDDCEYAYGDFDLNGLIDAQDLAVLLDAWGIPNPVVGDITGDGVVNGQDLAALLNRWSSGG